MAPGQLEQGLAGFGLHVRGVDHREPAELEPFGGDVMKDLEGMRRDSLVVFVVRNHCAACVGRETSLGRKCLPKVVLPEPLGPIRTTRLSLGILMSILATSSTFIFHRPRQFIDKPLVRVKTAFFDHPSGCGLARKSTRTAFRRHISHGVAAYAMVPS